MSSQNNNTTTTEEQQSLAVVVSHTQQPRTIQIAETLSLRLPFLQFGAHPPPDSTPPPPPPPPPVQQEQPPEASILSLLSDLSTQLEEWLRSGQIAGNRLLVFINGRTGSLTVVEGGVREWLFEKRGALPASKKAIEGLKRVEVKESNNEEEKRECVICLEEYEVGDEVREMPCKHWFHEKCVNQWLMIHGTCPLCRFNIQNTDLDDDHDNDLNDDDEEEEERVMIRVFLAEDGDDNAAADESAVVEES